MSDIAEELVTVEELCDILHVGRNTAYKILRSGKLKSFRVSKTWKIPREGVRLYIREQSKLV